MALFYTADPARDALAYEDSMERQCEIHEAEQAREQTRLSDAFVSAAERGASEPLEKSDMSEALYEVQCSQPELVEAFFWRAATQTSDPVLRAMVREVADAWAEIQSRETRA